MNCKIYLLILTFLCGILLLGSAFVAARIQPEIRDLSRKVFIGQAYPSGNVYLKRFSDDLNNPSPSPKGLLILPLGNTKNAVEKKIEATFVKTVEGKTEEENGYKIAKYLYFPGDEGMEGPDDHNSCGLGVIKKVESYEYLSGDFYRTVFD
jgi:hypothetical protein